MRDLSLHILDLVQNGVEAGGRNVALAIREDLDADRLCITVEDDGRGMSPEFAARAKSPFTTSRTTRKVGLGLPLIDMTTQMAGGGLDIQSRPGEGTRITASYQHSHIDRPPLGDIATTVKIITVSYQQILFRYEHSKKLRGRQKSFVLDTRELRGILGAQVDFGESLVREWLDGYLKEGLSALDDMEG
jgi:anti-sigma regulatory factor (Ser/Thr protein kinase)